MAAAPQLRRVELANADLRHVGEIGKVISESNIVELDVSSNNVRILLSSRSELRWLAC